MRDKFGRFVKGHTERKGCEVNEETRKKISDKLKGKVSVGTLRNLKAIGAARKGVPLSQERKDKLSEIMKRRPLQPHKEKVKHSYGYILIYSPNHPFCDTHKHVREHRLIVETQIGRYLQPQEECHHRNNIKDDNCKENLMAFISKSAHRRFEKGGTVRLSEIIFDGKNLEKRR